MPQVLRGDRIASRGLRIAECQDVSRTMKMAPMKREKFRHKPIGFVGTERDLLANKAVLHSQRCHDFDPGAVLGGHLGALRLLARRQTAVAVLRVVTRTKAGLEVFPEQIGLTE